MIRLPIVQGGTFTFLAPTFAILSLPHNECPADFDTNGWGNNTNEYKTEQWQNRMQEVSIKLIYRESPHNAVSHNADFAITRFCAGFSSPHNAV